MKQQVFIIHGGNVSNNYQEYLKYLKAKKVTLDDFHRKDWKSSLGEKLGRNFEVHNPVMPNKQNAKYLEWKIYFEKIIPLMKAPIILVGHSLGGIFLTKYLSEKKFPKKILATFLIAAPFTNPTKNPLADFNLGPKPDRLAQQGGSVYFYQSKDDKVVPYSNVVSYQKVLPGATYRIYQNRGHFNVATLPELVRDIKNLYP